MTVIRERSYDSKGRLLSSSQRIRKRLRVAFEVELIPVYRTVKALPFYTTLSKPAAKTK
jgi:hypothetical protein